MMAEMGKENSCGTLFGVGVGPGDPELLTLRAVRLIQAAPVIAVPCASADGKSYALQIAQDLLRPEQLVVKLHFAMARDLAVRRQHRQRAAQCVAEHLAAGRDVAFLTEGDPLLYSTFAYLLALMPEGTPVEVVPGVSSYHAAAAQVRQPLAQAGQRLAILPATVENLNQLPAILDLFDTIVLFKIKHTFERVLQALDALDLTAEAVLVERASHPLAQVVHAKVALDLRSVQEGGLHYLSLLILSSSNRGNDAD